MWDAVRVARRSFAPLAVLLLVLPGTQPGAAAAEPDSRTTPGTVRYVRPVPGEVVRAFEPPAGTYGPGHRGVDLAARPGDPVAPAAEGRVVHAGPVAGTTWVSIDHADGIRTAYGPLADIAVARGDDVSPAHELGQLASGGHGHLGADEGLHLSARRGGVHFDPMTLFAPGRPSLVGPGSSGPEDDRPFPAGEDLGHRVVAADDDGRGLPGRRARPGPPARVTARRWGSHTPGPPEPWGHHPGGRPPRRAATLPAGPAARWARRHAHHTRSPTGDPGAPRPFVGWVAVPARHGTRHEPDPG